MTSRRVASNSFFLATAKVARLVVSMVLGAVLFRYLGAGDFGSWHAAISLCALVQVMISLGMDKVAIRECSIRPAANPEYLGNTLALKLAFSLAGAGVVFGLVRLMRYPPLMTHLIFIAFGVHVFSTLGDSFVIPFRSREKMQFEAAANMAKDLFLMFLVFLGLFLGFSVVGIGYFYLLAAIFYLLFAFVLTRRKFFRPRLRINRETARRLVAAGLPLGAAIFFNSYHDVIKIAVQRILGGEAAGYYSAAALTYQAWERTVLLSLMAALFPVLSRLHAGDREVLARSYRRMSKYLYIISLPWAAACLLLSEEIVALIFGPGALPAAPVVRILGLVSILMFQNYLLYNAMVAARKERLFALIMGAAAIFNLALTLALIRTPLGISGGAVALGAAQLLTWLLFVKALRVDYRVYPLRRDWPAPAVSALVAAGVFWWVRELGLPFGVIVVAGGFAYLAGLVVMRSLRAADYDLFKRLITGDRDEG